MLFGVNSISNTIEIAQGEAECCFNCFMRLIPNITGYPCYHSLIVGQLYENSFALVATLYHSLSISVFQRQLPLELHFQPMAPPTLSKNIPSNMGRASVVNNDIVSN